MRCFFKIVLPAFLLLLAGVLPSVHAAQTPAWEYSYEGDALPTQSLPAWELLEPKVKAGMIIENRASDGVLRMTFKGGKATSYYHIGWSGQGQVWRGDSEPGSTLELRTRVVETVPGVANTFLLSLSGFGSEKKHNVVLYFNAKGVLFGTKNIPLDLTQFHTFRITFDPATKTFALFIDDAAPPAAELSLTVVEPAPYASNKIIIGGTYAPGMQGAFELDYLRWTNKGVFAPDAKLTVPASAPAPASKPASKPGAAPVRKPINLSDPDIARANQLFTSFERLPQLTVPLTLPPLVDGAVNEEEWKAASRFVGLVSNATRQVVQKPTRFFVQHDEKNVYLAFQLDRPDGVAPIANTTSYVDNLWNKEDGLEIVISPDMARRAAFSLYVNGASGYSNGFIVDGSGFDTSRKGGWNVRSRITPRGVEGEVAIAKNDFLDVLNAKNTPLDTKSWGLNVMRVDLAPAGEISDWSDMWGGAGNYNGNFLGRLLFRPDALAVHIETIGALDNARSGIRGELVNNSAVPVKAKLSYALLRATRNVREAKIHLYETWDKVNRIRTTGSDFDEGEDVQLLLGEDTWLKNLGRAYEVVKEGTLDVSAAPKAKAPFEVALDQAGGQFIFAAKLTDVDGGVLWAQTAPVEVKAKVELDVVKRFLTANGVVVHVDVSGTEAVKAGDRVESTLLTVTGNKVLTRWQNTVANRFVPLEKFIEMKTQPPGNYRVETRLISQAGEVLGSNKTTFSKPKPPTWWKNKIGCSNMVPSPFTAVKATPTSTSIWGRTYFWNAQSPFPKQIETKKSQLLAAPIELILVSGGKKLSWKTASWKLVSAMPRTATYRSLHTAGDFKLALTTTVDFDGLMRFQGEFSGAKIPVDSLKLRFPIRREMVTHYHGARFGTDVQTSDGLYKAGSLRDLATDFPENATPFAALFWLGGSNGGMQWIAEWDKGWRNPDRNRVMKILTDDEKSKAVTLEVSFIGEKTTLSEALPIDFGLNVSPVKDTSYFWKMGTANGVSNAMSPKNFDAAKARADLKVAKENGITHVMTGGYGWPFHADIWVRDHNRPHYKEISQAIHDAGLKNFYYGSWGYDINGEEARDFAHDMIKLPRRASGTDTYWYNPEGPWVDFFMAGLEKGIKDFGFDGIYLDSMPVTGMVADPLLGQTYTDEKGRLHGRWPIWSLRKWALRMQNVFRITHRKDGIVYQHDSSVPNLAIVSLADVRTGGEDAPSRDSLRSSWPLDTYIARNSIHMFGVPMETLWYNWWQRPLKENNVLSVILLHGQMKNRTGGDLLPYRNKADYELETTPHIPILKLFQNFDIPHAQWWPYHGEKNWVALEPTSLFASSYVHPGKRALVVVSNLDKRDVNATVRFDLAAAGFKPGQVKVTDAFLKTEIPLQEDTIKLDLLPERYRLLLVEAK